MLSSKSRILWIKYHAYISCFFLPFALLIALTGILYLFDIKGGPSEKFEYLLSEEIDFPLEKKEAKAFIENYLTEKQNGLHLPLPSNYWEDHAIQGWWDFHGGVMLDAHDDNQLKIQVETNNLMRKLLYIHKGIAGDIFVIFGILFGISLLFSLLSGTIVALVMPKLKKNAVIFMLAGALSVLVTFFAS